MGRGTGPADDRDGAGLDRAAGSRGSRFASPTRRARGLLWPQELRVVARLRPTAPRPCRRARRRRGRGAATRSGLPAPLFVLPNGGGWAYGDFVLDAASLALPDAVAARDRRSADARQRVGHAVGRAARRRAWRRRRFWTWRMHGAAARDRRTAHRARCSATSPARGGASCPGPSAPARAARSRRCCATGWRGDDGEPEGGVVRRAARRGADTRRRCAGCERVWEKTRAIAGLPLAEADYTALAQELAVREVPGWAAILDDAARRASRTPIARRDSQFVDAGALRRSRRARAVVPVARAT